MGKKKAPSKTKPKKTDDRTRKMIAAGRAAAAVDRRPGKQVNMREHVEAKARRASGKAKASATRAAKTAKRETYARIVEDGKRMVSNGNDFPISPVTADDPRVPGDIKLDRKGNVVPTVVPDRLPVGEPVFVSWPGTSDGTNRRRGVLDGYTADGKPKVLIAYVNAKGEYTGGIAAKPRTFERYEVFSISTECNSQRGVWEAIRPGESAAAYDERIARGPSDAELASTDALAGAAAGEPACSGCGARLMFSARGRGDGLCGPCSRAGAGTLDDAPGPVIIETDEGVETVRDVESAISEGAPPPPDAGLPWGDDQPRTVDVPMDLEPDNLPRPVHVVSTDGDEYIARPVSAKDDAVRDRMREQLAAAGYCAESFKSDRRDDDVCTLVKQHKGLHENSSVGLVENDPNVVLLETGERYDRRSPLGPPAKLPESWSKPKAPRKRASKKPAAEAPSSTPTPEPSRNEAGEPECVPHPACGGQPRLEMASDGVTGATSYSVYCASCNTPPHERVSRDSAVAAWNKANGAGGKGDVSLPAPVISDVNPASVPADTQPAKTDAELLAAMGNPHAPPATVEEANARLEGVNRAVERALEKAGKPSQPAPGDGRNRAAVDAERTAAKAAVVEATTAACPKCGSAMITTRTGTQRVCARCDYFEKRAVDGAWSSSSDAPAPTTEATPPPQAAADPFRHRLPSSRMDAAQREYDRIHGPFATFAALRAAMMADTPAAPPPATAPPDEDIPMMPDDDVPADTGRMPWD